MGALTCEPAASITKTIEAENFLEQEKRDEQVPETSVYEQLLPRDEGRVLRYLRSWERSLGLDTPVIYVNAISIITLHVLTVLATVEHLCCSRSPAKWQTTAFTFLTGIMAGFGVTAGVHRYWCHRSYKATRPMQVILLVCYTVAAQIPVLEWVRDHRVHHKFSETRADPHDAHRGFFFSHVGWLMMKKHPEVLRRGRQLDMSDITSDPLLRFYDKHFQWLRVLGSFAVPILVPALCWRELWWHAFISSLFRFVISLNCTWSVNSFAHLFGNKPYDKSIMPAENRAVSFFAMGEGWHNYHHTFPWDYKAAELPYTTNLTTLLLDLCKFFNLVYDARQATPDIVRTVRNNKGDKKLS